MGDLLSSSSLILAIVGMLYSLWYPEIQKALSSKLSRYKEDRGEIYKEITNVIYGRAIPLATLAILTPVIFLPDTIKTFNKIYVQIITSDVKTFFLNYDSVGIAFCVVEIVTLAIGIHILTLSLKLINLRYFKK
jgi:hypothetical protein